MAPRRRSRREIAVAVTPKHRHPGRSDAQHSAEPGPRGLDAVERFVRFLMGLAAALRPVGPGSPGRFATLRPG
jgi:hypothetical protein